MFTFGKLSRASRLSISAPLPLPLPLPRAKTASRFLASTQHRAMASSTGGIPSETAQTQDRADAATATTTASSASHNIKNTTINEGTGVKLSDQQRTIVGSVLDLFEGNPTLKHLSLWKRDAVFEDNITSAAGYDKFAAQWYGLPALFNPIKIQKHTVTSGGNPIELKLSNKYVLKGIKKEQTIDSVVSIFLGGDGKIEKVQDKWGGTLPEGAISQAFRKLNAVTVPALVKVPKTEEEDNKMKAEREKSQ